MRQSIIALTLLSIVQLHGCGGGKTSTTPPPPPSLVLPDIQVATTLPQFAKEVNEVQIADSFNDVDPTWVIGALVNIKTGKIYALDSYLKTGAKPAITPQTEIVFKNFIENSVAANAQWLEFVKAEVSDATRAEVSVAKTIKVSVDSQSIDREQLLRQLRNNKILPREDFGVVIGYTNYVLNASYFRNTGANGTVSGYGAKIGGSWFSKSENSSSQHRIVAVWSPLPFVIETLNNRVLGDLSALTVEAANAGKINVPKLAESPLRNFRMEK